MNHLYLSDPHDVRGHTYAELKSRLFNPIGSRGWRSEGEFSVPALPRVVGTCPGRWPVGPVGLTSRLRKALYLQPTADYIQPKN
jgi:hypothetical protein